MSKRPFWVLAVLLPWLVLASLATVSTPAAASAQGPIQVDQIRQAAEKSEDRSRNGLRMVFGDVVVDPLASGPESSAGKSGQTMVSDVFRVLNGLGLVLGIVLVAYVIFRKLFSFANEGQIFQREGNAFGVIKIVWGFIALIPTTSGWSMAQLAILWGASLIGVGTANLATDAALESFADGASMIVEPARPDTQALSASLFEANLCALGINQSVQEARAAGADIPNSAIIRTVPLENTGFLLTSGTGKPVCGGARYPEPSQSVASYLGLSTNSDQARQAQIKALNAMQTYLAQQSKAFAEAVASEDQKPPSATLIIDAAARRYDQALGSLSEVAGAREAEIRKRVVESVSNRGWWELGAWYNAFAKANAVTTDNMQNTAMPIGQSLHGGSGLTAAYRELSAVAKSNREEVATYGSNGANTTGQDSSTDSDSVFHKLFSGLGQKVTTWLIDQDRADNGTVNPLVAMKSLGDNILVTSDVVLAGYVAANVAGEAGKEWADSVAGKVSGVVSLGATDAAIGGVIGAIKSLSPFIVLAVIALVGFGLTLSVWIPAMPFLIWFAAIINWVAFVAIGVVAAPLWAFVHLTGDGQDQRVQHGYIFLINAMLRPVIMVAAFFIAGAIVVMGGTLLNNMFPAVMSNVQSDSFTGVATILAFIALYCSMCLTLVTTAFNLVFLIPDKVIEWIGGTQLASGQGDEHQHKQAGNQIGAFVGDTNRQLSRRGPGGAGSTPGKNAVQNKS